MNDEQYVKNLNRVTVLYVEDDSDIREVFSRFLKRRVSRIWFAADGEEGLRLYHENRPDIIITDINMPVMDGISFVEHIRKIDDEIPVIISTAHSDEKFLLRAINLGVDRFIVKPVSKDQLIFSLQKIASHIILKKAVEDRNRLLKTVLDNSPSFVVITYKGEPEWLNPSFLEFLGFDSFNEFINSGKSINDYLVQREDVHTISKPIETWSRSMVKDIDFKPMVYLSGANQLKSTARYYLIDIAEDPADFERLIIFLTDVSLLETEKKRYKELSLRDPLTGVFNRHKLEESYTTETERARRHNRAFSVIMFDLDHFKSVNDTYGHQAGDRILADVAGIVQKNIRRSDILIRYGGEEFIILCPETTLKGAVDMSEKLRHDIEIHSFSLVENLTCSFGVSAFNHDNPGRELIKLADDALYTAKKEGRNRVRSADSE